MRGGSHCRLFGTARIPRRFSLVSLVQLAPQDRLFCMARTSRRVSLIRLAPQDQFLNTARIPRPAFCTARNPRSAMTSVPQLVEEAPLGETLAVETPRPNMNADDYLISLCLHRENHVRKALNSDPGEPNHTRTTSECNTKY